MDLILVRDPELLGIQNYGVSRTMGDPEHRVSQCDSFTTKASRTTNIRGS